MAADELIGNIATEDLEFFAEHNAIPILLKKKR